MWGGSLLISQEPQQKDNRACEEWDEEVPGPSTAPCSLHPALSGADLNSQPPPPQVLPWVTVALFSPLTDG
jgi:hypothetical protein